MELYPILWLIVAAISVVPMIVFWKGYFRLGAKKIRLTAIAFTLFFFKALTVGSELFLDEADEGTWFLNDEFWLCVAAILDMIIISLIVITFGGTNGTDEESANSAGKKSSNGIREERENGEDKESINGKRDGSENGEDKESINGKRDGSENGENKESINGKRDGSENGENKESINGIVENSGNGEKKESNPVSQD